jgi:hypothetical protein
MSLTGILPTSNALAEETAKKFELSFKPNPNPTVHLDTGEKAPYPGYLVDEGRLEKVLIAIKELEATKNEMKFRIAYMEEKAKNDKMLFEQQMAAKDKEYQAVEKELKAKIAELDVWYKKPLFVAGATAIIFIATGFLLH